ncbi:hypothetical protein [Pontibacter populi]|uniref:DUF4369 domain-containing protein n=1 Tax=Pontibacter populi TaxID=890055 RepID=A0ABV1RUR5_9BACT
MKVLIATLSIILLILLCSSQSEIPDRVSFIKLLANPEDYHGKRVMVTGFLHLDFEDYGLYFSDEHGNYLNSESAFWVDFAKTVAVQDDKGKEVSIDALNRRYVMIIGVFNKDSNGHLGAFAGEIHSIEKVYQLKKWYND